MRLERPKIELLQIYEAVVQGCNLVLHCCLALVTYRNFRYGGFTDPASLHFFSSSLLRNFVALPSLSPV